MDSDKKSEKPKEQEAVYTTIVGGRPPGSGTSIGNIPRGIEVLVKKASVDEEFRKLLLEKRAEAAKEIELELDQTEAAMLGAISREQLEKIIDNTKVPTEHKGIFLRKLGKAMLAIVLAGAASGMMKSCDESPVTTKGIQPDRIQQIQAENNNNPSEPNDSNDNDPENTVGDTPAVPENNWQGVSRGISPVRD